MSYRDQPAEHPVTLELFVTRAEMAAVLGRTASTVRDFLRRVEVLFGAEVATACRTQIVGLVVVPYTPARARRFRWLN